MGPEHQQCGKTAESQISAAGRQSERTMLRWHDVANLRQNINSGQDESKSAWPHSWNPSRTPYPRRHPQTQQGGPKENSPMMLKNSSNVRGVQPWLGCLLTLGSNSVRNLTSVGECCLSCSAVTPPSLFRQGWGGELPRLACLLACWLAGWLPACLPACLFVCLPGCLAAWLPAWLPGCLAWLAGCGLLACLPGV